MATDFITPEALAEQTGWSARQIRTLARKIGARRILGRRIVLTADNVTAILEATKPKPRSQKLAPSPTGLWHVPQDILDFTYEDLVSLRATNAATKAAGKRTQQAKK